MISRHEKKKRGGEVAHAPEKQLHPRSSGVVSGTRTKGGKEQKTSVFQGKEGVDNRRKRRGWEIGRSRTIS